MTSVRRHQTDKSYIVNGGSFSVSQTLKIAKVCFHSELDMKYTQMLNYGISPTKSPIA